MKSYEELEANAYKKAESVIAAEKRRKTILLRRSVALTLGTAAVLGIGIFTHAMKPPKKPTSDRSGIIVETETTSAETTSAQTSSSTAAPKTTTTKQMTTATTTATTASARQSVTTVRTTATAARTTTETVRTTAAASPTTTTAAQTTAAAVQTTVSQTTTAKTTHSYFFTTAAVQTSANAYYYTGTTPQTGLVESTGTQVCSAAVATTPVTLPPTKQVRYGEYEFKYNPIFHPCRINDTEVTVADDEVGDFVEESIITIDHEYTVPCTLYEVKNYSPNFALAVKTEDDPDPKLYVTYSSDFKTLGELIEATDMENSLILGGVRNENHYPIDKFSDTSELLKILTDTEQPYINGIDARSLYYIEGAMPQFGIKVMNFVVLSRSNSSDDYYVSMQILGGRYSYRITKEQFDSYVDTFTSE